MRISKMVVALLVSVVAVTVMTGVAVAHPGGAASPAQVTVDLPNDTPTNVQFQFWDISTNQVNQAKFYLWKDNINDTTGLPGPDGVGDDIDGDGVPQEIPDDLCNHIAMSWDSVTYVTNSMIVNAPVWDAVVGGQPSASETTYTKTIAIKDANNGAALSDHYFISGSAGSQMVAHVLVTNTSIDPIPEFATIAIPAIAVLGLFLFFNKRKHKKD